MESSLQLYQVGSCRLALYSEADNYLYDDSASGKSKSLPYSNRILPVNTQFARDSRDIKWSGFLLGTEAKRRDQVLQELRSQVGLPQPIIGYVYLNQAVDIGCGCRHCSDGCTLLWFEAVGEMTRVRPRAGDEGIPELEITVALHSHWRGLNRYHWYFGGQESKLLGQKTPNPDYQAVIDARDWPSCQQIFSCNTCHAWEYQDYNSHDYRFDPDYWDALFNCSCNCLDHRAGQAASWQTGNHATQMFIDQALWGADTVSIYAFRGLPTTGEIYINVSYRKGVGQQFEQSRLSLEDIDSAISDAALGNLLSTDELFIGDVLERRNGTSYPRAFIRRDGDILPVFVPIAASPQISPGKLGAGHAAVSIIVPDGVETAYQHIYQRL